MTESGYQLLPGACRDSVDLLRDVCVQLLAGTHALRNVFRHSPILADTAFTWATHPAVVAHLGLHAVPIRGLLFDKIPEANWQVPWHRDRQIAVSSRRDLPGWGPWSVKDGIAHVEPPAPWLHRRVAVRLHLDDCSATQGALRVIPGSHLLSDADAMQLQPVTITVAAGDVLLMHPLLLHASSPAASPSHRRVIHLEFAADVLPEGLEWAEAT